MEELVNVLNLKFKSYIDSTQIQDAVKRIASQMNDEFSKTESAPLFISVLNGSFIFASDLLRQLKIQCQIEFIRLKSYEGVSSTENLLEIIGLNVDMKGRHIIILEDIVDTGHTLDKLVKKLQKENPKSIKIAALIFKKEAFKKDFQIDYLGFEIENKFIVGYGMDYNDYGRNLSEIYQVVN
jgi:hypoxanthine phosphoribosyltransferase